MDSLFIIVFMTNAPQVLWLSAGSRFGFNGSTLQICLVR